MVRGKKPIDSQGQTPKSKVKIESFHFCQSVHLDSAIESFCSVDYESIVTLGQSDLVGL